VRLLRGGGCAAAADVISVAAAARCSIALAPSMVGVGAAAGMRCAKRFGGWLAKPSLCASRERVERILGRGVVARGNRG
jgi:hypothetical protein